MIDETIDTNRGELFVKFINPHIDLSKSRVLDVGCKKGAFSLALAKHAKHVTGIDVNNESLAYLKKKAEKISNLTVEFGDILKTKYPSASFDLIIMEGVLEWVGYSYQIKSPIHAQKTALEECKRLLKPNGLLFIGIENRMFPPFWLTDPHTRTPLTAILPWCLAKRIHKGYNLNILGYNGYKRLLSKDFHNIDISIPIPHYKYIYVASKDLRKDIKEFDIEVLPNYKRWLRALKWISFLPKNHLIAPNLIILARRK